MNAVLLLASTLYLESANQGRDGHLGCASVIWNSARDHSSEALVEECVKPKRYSCWNGRTPDIHIVSNEILTGRTGQIPEIVLSVWSECLAIARSMVDGSFQPTIDAEFFWRYDNKNERTLAPSLVRVAQIGDHVFYRKARV